MEVVSKSLGDLPQIAEKVAGFADDKLIWLFLGEMGAGKTTLIKSICDHFGVMDTVSSPSFSIVNEYRAESGKAIYHFDFYRLKNQEEAMDIGVEEYFDSGNVCLLEWPEKIPDLLPENCLTIEIKIDSKNQRLITLTHNG